MDIGLLNRTLEVTENPGLDTLDPRFGDLTSLIEGGDFAGAAAQSEVILKENVYDVRIMGYFLYGLFLEQGLPALGDIGPCLRKLFQENWAALGPVKNREKHAKSTLGWLVKLVLKKLEAEQEKQAEAWQAWTAAVGSDQAQSIAEALRAASPAVVEVLKDDAKPVAEGLQKIGEWLVAYAKLVYKAPEAEKPPETEAVSAAAAPGAAPSGAVGVGEVVVKGSYHLGVLLRKLQVFEQLMVAEKIPKAAVLADDIETTLAAFDPRLFLPEVFKTYAKLCAARMTDLSSAQAAKDSPEWKAMATFLKVDMDGFAED